MLVKEPFQFNTAGQNNPHFLLPGSLECNVNIESDINVVLQKFAHLEEMLDLKADSACIIRMDHFSREFLYNYPHLNILNVFDRIRKETL